MIQKPSHQILLLSLFVVSLFISACSDTKVSAPVVPKVVKGVALEEVKAAQVPDTIELVGTVKARTSAVVSARVPGSIAILRVREGDRVSKGQLLAQLDSVENLAQASGAEAQTDEAIQGLEEARSRMKLTDATFERFKKLHDEQAVTRQEFEQKQTEKELAHQAVARAEARLRQARQGGRAAGAMADYTKIISSISGVVTLRQAELGATVFPGQPLFTIEDTGSYQVELAVPESLSPKVKQGSSVKIMIDSLGYANSTKIAEVVPAADPASRTFIAKAPVSRPGLKSGMFARGAVLTGNSTNGILLSKTAVFERGGLTAVWAVDKDNIARLRLVKPGKVVNDKIEIISGITDGDRVVISGLEKITDGVKIDR